MSAPGFNTEMPPIAINMPSEEEEKHICTMCNPAQEFGSAGGLGSHITHKHKNKEKDEAENLEVTLKEVYDQGDMVRILVPRTSQATYDRKKNIWVFNHYVTMPEGFVLSMMLRQDVVFPATDTQAGKRAFNEYLLVKKDKVILND